MIIFIYGQEEYLAGKYLNQIKNKFTQKYTNLGYEVLDFLEKKYTFEEIVRSIYAMGFFGGKRLIVIKDFIGLGGTVLQEKIEKLLSTDKNTTDIVFYERKTPKKLNKFYKFLVKNAKVKEFAKLNNADKNQMIKRIIADKIDADKNQITKRLILAKFMNSSRDLFFIENEIEKIALFLHDNDKDDIEDDLKILISEKTEENIFAFTDALGRKKTKLVLEKLDKLIASGVNEFYILTMIAFEIKNLMIVKDVEQNLGIKNSYQIARTTKLNPYVVTKSMPKTRLYKLEKLKKIYKMLMKMDIDIKNGKILARQAIEILIVKICRDLA